MADIDQTSPKAKGKRLRMLRELAGLTRSELSELAGVGSSSVQYWEDGRSSGLQRKSAAKIIGALQPIIKCNYNWLYEGIGASPKIHNDRHTQKHPKLPKNLNFPIELKPEIEFFKQNNPKSLIINVTNDDLSPLLKTDDIAGGNPLNKDSWLENIGEICFYQKGSINHIGIVICIQDAFFLQQKLMQQGVSNLEKIPDEAKLYRLVWTRKTE